MRGIRRGRSTRRLTLFIQFNNVARHNALSVDMWEAVPVLLNQAEHDPRVRLVVFTGAGEKAFVSGADISQFEDNVSCNVSYTIIYKLL